MPVLRVLLNEYQSKGRLMKISTALFGSVVAICSTVGLVNGQVKFADGSEQTTAFTGFTTAPPGKAFHVYIPSTGILSTGKHQLSPPVPTGQELVILQTASNNQGFYLSSRIGGIDPKYLIYCREINPTYDPDGILNNYPDGTLIVDEGQELWIEVSDYDHTDSEYEKFGRARVLGYYRNK